MSFFDGAVNFITKGADAIFQDDGFLEKGIGAAIEIGKNFFAGDDAAVGVDGVGTSFQDLSGKIAQLRPGISSTGGNIRSYAGRPSQVTVAQYVQRSASYAQLIAAINESVGNVATRRMQAAQGRVSPRGRTKAPKALSTFT